MQTPPLPPSHQQRLELVFALGNHHFFLCLWKNSVKHVKQPLSFPVLPLVGTRHILLQRLQVEKVHVLLRARHIATGSLLWWVSLGKQADSHPAAHS